MGIGDRIHMARRAARLSQRDLAARVNVSAQAISKYERNLDIPGSAVLLRLAEALGVPVNFFFREPSHPDLQPEYRKRAALPKRDERAILARTQEWLERYLEVEAVFPQKAVYGFVPPESLHPHVALVEDAEAVAEDLRDAWQLGRDPIGSMAELLETRGIKVGLIPAHDGFDGLLLSLDERSYVIALNKDLPGDRQRFTLAHELGHALLRPVESVSAERAAHRFAAAFLVPASAAREELGTRRSRLTTAELYSLKHKYGLSMQAWIRRAYDLEIISEPLYLRLNRDFRRKGWHRNEPGEALPKERPQRMERLVFQALAEDLITESRAAELLSLPRVDLRRRLANPMPGP